MTCKQFNDGSLRSMCRQVDLMPYNTPAALASLIGKEDAQLFMDNILYRNLE